MNKWKMWWLVALLLMPTCAMAAPSSVGLHTIMSTFQTTTQGWYNSIFSDALGLFGALFGIELTWLAVTWMITGKDVHDIFSSFIRKLISIGFFYTVLLYANKWVPWVIGGFKNVAITAGGEPETTVSDIAMTGLQAFVTCIGAGPAAMAHASASAWNDLWSLNGPGFFSSVGNAFSATVSTVDGIGLLAGLITGIILLLAFTYVVLELVAVQLEGMIVLSVGVLMLGFGGLRFTTRFAEGYMQYAVAVGVRLMVITLWASFIEWQVNPLIHTTLINGDASMTSYGIVIILAALIAWLTKKLPGFANSILSGQSTLSGGELYSAVKGGMVAALAVGAAAVTGGVAAAGAGIMSVAEAAGLASGGTGAASGGLAGGAGAMGAAGGTSASAGVSAPVMSGTVTTPGTASAGVPAPTPSGPASTSGVQAPSSATSGTASAGVAAPTRSGTTPGAATSGTQAPASGTTNPRPSAPSAPATTTPASVGSAVAAPLPPTGSGAPNATPTSSAGSAVAAPKAPATDTPSAFDKWVNTHRQTQDAIHGAHDTLMPGSPSTGGVSAPKIDLKHLD